MKIIISPAKIMKECYDDLGKLTKPVFYDDAFKLREYLKSLDKNKLQEVYNCNDKILEENLLRFENFSLDGPLSMALLSYDGLQFKKMAPNAFSNDAFNYVNKNLCILSGLYGVVRPMDGIIPYRLEMQAQIDFEGYKSLYDYWGQRIFNEVTKDDKVVLNLASKEYSLCLEKYLTSDYKFVTCIFANLKNGKLVVKATEAKTCRGLMVNFLAENNYHEIDDVKKFNELGFTYHKEYSDDETYVFIKE